MKAVAAVDLGATSGRVMLGYVGHNELSLKPVARFPNNPVRSSDGLHWDILGLYNSVITGLTSAVRDEPDVVSVGVDSWAVDYALIRNGQMVGPPFHYRDDRTTASVDRSHALIGAEELYRANGLQHLPFNTLFQLEADAAALPTAESFLLVPDLFDYWLTGRRFAERTNASTTGLLDPISRDWDDELIARLGLPRRIFPELVDAGTTIGTLQDSVRTVIGADLEVTTVGSHDTASAVVAIPSVTDDFAYISCGTWGLVGVELDHPIISEAGRLANFTNEGGVDGRVRYLHNVMGLWLLSESVRTWEAEGMHVDLAELLAAASGVGSPVAVFDANDPVFLIPGDMPTRIATWCREHDQPVPTSAAEFVRSIVESLADAFADAVHTAANLSGKLVNVIHIVGGGSQNELLCQRIADRSGLTVLAGPVEATAMGNVLVQARAHGIISGSLEAMRSRVSAAVSPVSYTPLKGTTW